MAETRDSPTVREKIHTLLSRAFVRLKDSGHPVGVQSMAAEAFSDIRSQFTETADEATIFPHKQLKNESRRWLIKNVCAPEDQKQAGSTQQLTFEGHLFQFLHPAYMVEREGDSRAVLVSDLSIDEWRAIISRMEAEAVTLAAEADEARTYVRLKFHVDIDPDPSQDDAAPIYEASKP